MLIHGVYWDDRYPVLATREDESPFGFDGEGIAIMAVGNLPAEIARAVILWRGKLTPAFEHLSGFVEQKPGS